VKYAPNDIELPQYGIPIDNIYEPDRSYLEKVEELICPICYDLIWKARECLSCGKMFCEFCIYNWIQMNGSKCPMCNQPLQIKEAKAFNGVFGKIRIKCIHKICKETPNYFDYVKHIENCKYRLYHCMNDGCICEDYLENIKKHSYEECQFRIIYCKYCSKGIKACNLKTHENSECIRNIENPISPSTTTNRVYHQQHYNENGQNKVCLTGRVDNSKNHRNDFKSKLEEKLKQQLDDSKFKKH
jgi:hypothetical protein